MKKLDETGSVLILALMLILLLTLTGLWSTQTSTVNTRISANENLYNVAFYAADVDQRSPPGFSKIPSGREAFAPYRGAEQRHS